MADKLSVPANVDNPVILKRFLNQLIVKGGLGGSSTWDEDSVNEFLTQVKAVNSNLDFLATVSKIEELRNNIRTLVEADLETLILQNKEDVALIAEQFGTFYDQAQAASWYGLSVKAGGAVAGLEVGSLDPDVTTPGDESSYFRIIANNFVLGRAYEDLSVEEKAYLSTNGLPSFGTVYNADKTPMPAIVTSWDNINKVYKHFFNGIVQFSNISGADYAGAINNGTTTINGGILTNNSIVSDKIRSYNLTSTNATIQNAMIGTLALAGEAVIVTRFASGSSDYITIYYTPTLSHGAIIFLSTDVKAYGVGMQNITLHINDNLVYSQTYTTAYAIVLDNRTIYTYLTAGVTYTFKYTSKSTNANTPLSKEMIIMGAKR